MSSSIKDLLEYNIVKKCNKCGIVKILSQFYFRKDTQRYLNSCNQCNNHKQKEWLIHPKELECGSCKIVKEIECFQRRNDTELGVRKTCKRCKKQKRVDYYKENSETLKKYQSEYSKNNRDKINEYCRNRRKTDPSFKLIHNTRSRLGQALRGNIKPKSSKEILGIDVETYKRWIEYQMTPEMNWSNIHIDHVRSISSFDVSNEDELLKAFNWKNTQPLLKEDNLRKGIKYNELDYQLQFIKAYEFLKLNGETVSD